MPLGKQILKSTDVGHDIASNEDGDSGEEHKNEHEGEREEDEDDGEKEGKKDDYVEEPA